MTPPTPATQPSRAIRPHPSRLQDMVLGIVIPCYNETVVLDFLLDELRRFMDGQPFATRILFVDDGSMDGTRARLDQAIQEDTRLAVVSLSRNFGHQLAVSAGLQRVTGDVVAVLDADLQDPPHVLGDMLALWTQGYDVVYGVRRSRKENFLLRSAYHVFYRALKRLAYIDIPLDAGDFCLMDRRVVDTLNNMPEHHRFLRGMRSWTGYRQIGLEYERSRRKAGSSKYTLRKLVRLALDGLISFSSGPLRLAAWLGLFCSFLGFLFIVWSIGSALFLDKVPAGWASVSVFVLFFSGIQLLVLGIIGEYVGRIFDEVKRRPLYIVQDQNGWVSPPGGGKPGAA